MVLSSKEAPHRHPLSSSHVRKLQSASEVQLSLFLLSYYVRLAQKLSQQSSFSRPVLLCPQCQGMTQLRDPLLSHRIGGHCLFLLGSFFKLRHRTVMEITEDCVFWLSSSQGSEQMRVTLLYLYHRHFKVIGVFGTFIPWTLNYKWDSKSWLAHHPTSKSQEPHIQLEGNLYNSSAFGMLLSVACCPT